MPTTLSASSRDPSISEFSRGDESAHCSKDALQNDLEVIYEVCKYGLIYKAILISLTKCNEFYCRVSCAL